MRPSPAILLLVASPLVRATEAFVKGVELSRAALYTASSKVDKVSGKSLWKCLNSTQEIPLEAVNDNYCDCDDGTDEPGTGACPSGPFYCQNQGHIGSYILASRVNDGLCEAECCDGSDEAPGVCPNLCHVVGEEYRIKTEAERKLRRTGSKIRSTYIAFATKEKARLEKSIESLSTELDTKRKEELRLKDVWERTSAQNEERIKLTKTSPAFSLLESHSSLLSHLTEREQQLWERIATLETILTNLKSGYNPNYQDMAVLEAVRGWDELKPAGKDGENIEVIDAAENSESDSSQHEWTEDRIRELQDTDALSALMEHDEHVGGGGRANDDFAGILFALDRYLPDALIPTYELVRDSFLGSLATVGLGLKSSPSGSSSDTILSAGASAKQTAYNDAVSSRESVENQLNSDRSSLESLSISVGSKEIPKYGLKGEWKKLEDKCIEKDTGEYTYIACFFGSATQRPNNGGMSNNLGNFKTWNTDSGHDGSTKSPLAQYSVHNFENGARCWNGPERSVKLSLTCGTENALLSVSEPEKCEYHFEGTSPALCWTDEELGLGSQDGKSGRDDL